MIRGWTERLLILGMLPAVPASPCAEMQKFGIKLEKARHRRPGPGEISNALISSRNARYFRQVPDPAPQKSSIQTPKTGKTA